MKILIINQPLRNRGDESAHKALVRSLCKNISDLEITVLFVDTYSESSIKQFDVHDSRVKYVSFKTSLFFKHFIKNCWKSGLDFLWLFSLSSIRILYYYKKADWVLSAPGGISMGGFQNWDHLCELEYARFLNKKIAYYGRSFGPFPDETKSQKKYKKISFGLLKDFDFLAIRDKETEKLADEIGLKYFSTVDSAFLETPIVDIPYEVRMLIGNKPYMVFVPNLLIWHYAFKNRITKELVMDYYSNLLDIMMEQYSDCNVVMLPQTFDYYTYEGDDVIFFRDLANKKKSPRIIVIPDCYSSDIQQTIIRDCKLLVGGRYHSVVFSLNQAVPFIALSYEHKIYGLLEALDKIDCMIDITHAFESSENMANSIEKFRSLIKIVKPDVEAQQNAKKIAMNCFRDFIKVLQNGK